MLLYAASKYYEKKDKGKVIEYGKRLLDTLPAKPAPQGVSEEDWNRNKTIRLGVAHWMLGVTASGDQRWADADLHLRAALPLVKDNKDLMAESLFHLGLANFKIGDPKKDKTRILEALKFNQQCAAMASPFQAQARKNVAAIKSQYHIP
jgi:tetratricopeptide (TPR) repeat protein